MRFARNLIDDAVKKFGGAASQYGKGIDNVVGAIDSGVKKYDDIVSPLERRIGNTLPGKAFDGATGLVKDELYRLPMGDLETLARGDISLDYDALSQVPGQLRQGNIKGAANSVKQGFANPVSYGVAATGLVGAGLGYKGFADTISDQGVQGLPQATKDYVVGAGLAKSASDIAGGVGKVVDDVVVEPAARWVAVKHGGGAANEMIEGAKTKFDEARKRPSRVRTANSSVIGEF